LDIKENTPKSRYKKTVVVYFAVSILTVAVDKIYALFGHGVSSDAMTFMFRYPLIGGVGFYLITGFLFPSMKSFIGYRPAYNIYNSGIALLTVGSFLQGIFEIAGTNSPFLDYYYIAGWTFIGAALTLFLYMAVNYRK
jgi:hypothetical protein